MNSKIIKIVYLIAGITSLTLGVIGAFLPVLPTTCFILLAAYCFSKSSDRLHNYLLSHPIAGKTIRSWQENGVIPLKIKVLSSAMMLLSVSYPIFFLDFHGLWKSFIVTTIIVALIYIWTRPSSRMVRYASESA